MHDIQLVAHDSPLKNGGVLHQNRANKYPIWLNRYRYIALVGFVHFISPFFFCFVFFRLRYVPKKHAEYESACGHGAGHVSVGAGFTATTCRQGTVLADPCRK